MMLSGDWLLFSLSFVIVSISITLYLCSPSEEQTGNKENGEVTGLILKLKEGEGTLT